MQKLILTRLAEMLAVCLLTAFLIFVLLALAGADPTAQWRLEGRLSDETAAALRSIYGADKPLLKRYLLWLGSLARGDFGQSISYGAPVATLLWPRFARTLAVAAPAWVLGCAAALAIGMAAARRPDSLWNRLGEALVLAGSSIPRIILALAALALIARLQLLEAATHVGFSGAAAPILVLSVPLTALFLAQTLAVIRSSARADHVLAARARGLAESTVFRRYILRPALAPLLVTAGTALAATLSGSVPVERILGWPGLGDMTVTAVRNRDVPLLLGITLIATVAVLAVNLAADLLQRFNDPRVRHD